MQTRMSKRSLLLLRGLGHLLVVLLRVLPRLGELLRVVLQIIERVVLLREVTAVCQHALCRHTS